MRSACRSTDGRLSARPATAAPNRPWQPLLSLAENLLHDLQSSRLQRTHAAPWQEPHAFLFGEAVKNLDPVVRGGVMERGAGVRLEELEIVLAPRVVHEGEEFFPERC